MIKFEEFETRPERIKAIKVTLENVYEVGKAMDDDIEMVAIITDLDGKPFAVRFMDGRRQIKQSVELGGYIIKDLEEDAFGEMGFRPMSAETFEAKFQKGWTA